MGFTRAYKNGRGLKTVLLMYNFSVCTPLSYIKLLVSQQLPVAF